MFAILFLQESIFSELLEKHIFFSVQESLEWITS